jgi:hypothetical protein
MLESSCRIKEDEERERERNGWQIRVRRRGGSRSEIEKDEKGMRREEGKKDKHEEKYKG